MSRQRGYFTNNFRKLRREVSIFKASEAEIQSDLKKLNHMKKFEPEPVEVVIKIELPKKRKNSVNDDKFAIDGLVRLMSTKSIEKKKVEIKEKSPEPAQKLNVNDNTWLNMINLQNQYMKNIMLASHLNFYQPMAFVAAKSSADRHLKAARFIYQNKNPAKKII
ncbi:hypothetical protein SteCoe_8085 [Stentor coeruleus]|uniref:Uncharacterized protein n=1 Tax=Stentor coeruleus TaxID=5963 RepID=A0A1R2CL92_9CILI|nr:hypothetical protein SteCoe_8085 [Stentor coeruleus]